MKKSAIKLIIIELTLFVALLLNTFVINIAKEYTLCLILGTALFLVIFLLGYEKDNHRYGKEIILNTLIYTLCFQVMIFLMGFFLGFIKNSYSLTFINIIKNISPIIVIIILSEILRYTINTKGEKNRLVISISLLVFVIIDLTLSLYLYDFSVNRDIFEMIVIIVLPSISKNLLLTFYSLTYGWAGSITYRFVMELPLYFMPLFTNLNLYLHSILMLLLPIFIFYRTYKSFRKKGNYRGREKFTTKKITPVILVTFVAVFICL